MTVQSIITDAEWGTIFEDVRETVYLQMINTAEKEVEGVVNRGEQKLVTLRQMSGESSDIGQMGTETHIRIKAADYTLVTVQRDKIRFKANKTDSIWTTKPVRKIIDATGTDIKVSVG